MSAAHNEEQTKREYDPDEEARMTFTEHLAELRTRIVRAAMAIGAGFLVCYFLADPIFNVVRRPLMAFEGLQAEPAVPDRGLYLAALGSDGKPVWDTIFGGALRDASPVAFAALPDGGRAIVANLQVEKERFDGLLITTKPETGEESEATTGQALDSIKSWEGVELNDVWVEPNGTVSVLGKRLPPAEKGVVAEPVVTSLVEGGEVVAEAPEAWKESAAKFTTLNPMEAVFTKLKLAGYAGILLALPIVVYQLCAFIFPGLRPSERRVIQVMIGGSSLFSILGVAVAYFGIFPLVLPYLLQWTPEGVEVQFRMNETVNIIIKGLIGFAIAFQLPMVVLVLVWLDLLTPQTLKQYRRVAYVGIAVLSAVLTPPDPGSMLLMGGPLVLLYEVSILLAYIIVRRRKKAEAAG